MKAQCHPFTWLVLLPLLLAACGPGTIFLRPELDTPAQHVENGHRLLSRGKIEAAEAEFNRAQSLDEDCVPAYIGLALVQAHLGNLKGGLELLTRAGERATTPEEASAVAQGYEQVQEIATSVYR